MYYPLCPSSQRSFFCKLEEFCEEVKREGYSGSKFTFLKEWKFPDILPTTKFRFLKPLSSLRSTVKQIIERDGKVYMEIEDPENAVKTISLEFFLLSNKQFF
jgi:hypothetical protein